MKKGLADPAGHDLNASQHPGHAYTRQHHTCTDEFEASIGTYRRLSRGRIAPIITYEQRSYPRSAGQLSQYRASWGELLIPYTDATVGLSSKFGTPKVRTVTSASFGLDAGGLTSGRDLREHTTHLSRLQHTT
jgi:hypothetical protein